MPEAINEAQRYIATMQNTLQNINSALDSYNFSEQQAEQVADNMDCLKLVTKNIANTVFEITDAAESKYAPRPVTMRDECIIRLQKTMYAIMVLKNQFNDVDDAIMDGKFTEDQYAEFVKLLDLAISGVQEITKVLVGLVRK